MHAGLPFPFDFALVAYGKAVLAGNGSDGRYQRCPSALRFNFVKAEQQARMKPTTHSTYMSPDPCAVENLGFIGSHHVFFQLCLEAFPRLDSADIKLVLEADQERSSVGDGVVRRGWLLVVVLGMKRHGRENQRQTPEPARTKRTHSMTSAGTVSWLDVSGREIAAYSKKDPAI